MKTVIRFLNDGTQHIYHFDKDGLLLSDETLTNLADIKQPDHPLIVLIPGSQVSMHQVTLPQMSRSEIEQAVPNVLEEKLPVPTETCYFAIGTPNNENVRSVGVINKTVWHQYLHALQEHELVAQAIMPDYLALPLTEDDWALLIEDDLALVRTGRQTGFTTDVTLLQQTLSLALSESTVQPEDIVNISESASTLPQINLPVAIMHEAGTIGSGHTQFNMLRASDQARAWTSLAKSPWKHVAKAVGALILLCIVGQLALLINYHFQRKHTDDQALTIYQSINPRAETLASARVDVERMIRAYKLEPNPFLHLINAFANAKAGIKNINLGQMTFDKNKTLTVTLTSSSNNDINALYQRLTKLGIQVKQNQSKMDGNRIVQTLTLGGH